MASHKVRPRTCATPCQHEPRHVAGYTRIGPYRSFIDTQRIGRGSFLACEPIPALPLSWDSTLVNTVASDDALKIKIVSSRSDTTAAFDSRYEK